MHLLSLPEEVLLYICCFLTRGYDGKTATLDLQRLRRTCSDFMRIGQRGFPLVSVQAAKTIKTCLETRAVLRESRKALMNYYLRIQPGEPISIPFWGKIGTRIPRYGHVVTEMLAVSPKGHPLPYVKLMNGPQKMGTVVPCQMVPCGDRVIQRFRPTNPIFVGAADYASVLIELPTGMNAEIHAKFWDLPHRVMDILRTQTFAVCRGGAVSHVYANYMVAVLAGDRSPANSVEIQALLDNIYSYLDAS